MVENFKGKTVIGEFRKIRKQRSLKQNSFFYAVTIPEIIESLVEAGYGRSEVTPRAVNQMLERMFLTVDIPSTEYAGEYITITREAKTLSVGEWMDFTADITKWAAEFLNTVLSVPLEQKEMDLL